MSNYSFSACSVVNLVMSENRFAFLRHFVQFYYSWGHCFDSYIIEMTIYNPALFESAGPKEIGKPKWLKLIFESSNYKTTQY